MKKGPTNGPFLLGPLWANLMITTEVPLMSDQEEPIELDLASLLGIGKEPKDFSDISLENYRTHMIVGEIDEFTSQEACEFLLKSYFEDPKTPVTLIINSPGGSCDHGFAIIDLMDTLPFTVRTIAMGQIMSMGFLIFTSGTKGERYMAPNGSFMSHQFSNFLMGKDFEVEATMKLQKMTRDAIVNHLIKCTGLTKKKVQDSLLPAHDVFLTAAECLELGVGDKFMDKAMFAQMAKEADMADVKVKPEKKTATKKAAK